MTVGVQYVAAILNVPDTKTKSKVLKTTPVNVLSSDGISRLSRLEGKMIFSADAMTGMVKLTQFALFVTNGEQTHC